MLTFVPESELKRLWSLPGGRCERAGALADACRLNTLSMIMNAGSGHIGSSFSSLDIVAWLHREVLSLSAVASDEPGDAYFSSKGHDAPGLYSVQVAAGLLPWESLFTLRQMGGLPGHPDVGTPGAVANTGSLGMGISKAKGISKSWRLRGRAGRLFVMTGDGELQEGQIWESLGSAASDQLGEIVVIVDHNRMQSDTWVEETSSLGDLESKFRAFGWQTSRCNGNDMQAIDSALSQLLVEPSRPKVLIADTVKGYGVGFMEGRELGPSELYKFHSGAPSDEHYRLAVEELRSRLDTRLLAAGVPLIDWYEKDRRSKPEIPSGGRVHRLTSAYSEALIDEATIESRLVALDADLVLDSGLVQFRERFPERFVECGIAEQDMVSRAGGLALAGHLPVVHSFACFLSSRPNEQIYNNATERKKIVYVGALAGLLPGGPGHSHQAIRDLCSLGAIPGLALVAPGSEEEMRRILGWAIREAETSVYLRYPSVPWPLPFESPPADLLVAGEGTVLRTGRDLMFIAYGPVLLSQAWLAAHEVERDGFSVGVMDLPWINNFDCKWVADRLKGVANVVVLDDHSLEGGLGQRLAVALGEQGERSFLLRCRGVTGVPACGDHLEVLGSQGLDAESLAGLGRSLLGGP